jgi:pilus assembly protein CpaB
MRSHTLIMIGMAATCGVLAVSAGRIWLDRQSNDRLRQIQTENKPAATKTIVVAALPVRYGTAMNGPHFKEIPWPEGTPMPKGAFQSIKAMMSENPKRVALAAIEENEIVLSSKVTGSGQRAILSSLIGEDMTAVTVRVSDIAGVAGFVLPGDYVDVMVTRQSDNKGYTDILMQNVRVLGVDQLADDKSDKPIVARAITVEAPLLAAQQLALASAVGTVSLALRKGGEQDVIPAKRLNSDQLGLPATQVQQLISSKGDEGKKELVTATLTQHATTATIGVIRGMERKDYSVPIEFKGVR